MSQPATLEALVNARQIASHAQRLGVTVQVPSTRHASEHIGAVLADCILQAGLNYRTVVWPRVQRIQINYPMTTTLSKVKEIVDDGRAPEFLAWNHPVKVSRFSELVDVLSAYGVEDVSDLKEWLNLRDSRDRMLRINGVGPKTFDYMCCLVGIDRIAVDRHIRSFALDAGVGVGGYEELQVVVSFAADLLGLPRRDFDAWIWQLQARDMNPETQPDLF